MSAPSLLACAIVLIALGCKAEPRAAVPATRVTSRARPLPHEAGWRVERVRRWSEGGELVRRTGADFWLRSEPGCGVAAFSPLGPVARIEPPGGTCAASAVVGSGALAFRLRDGGPWVLTDASGARTQSMDVDHLFVAGDEVLGRSIKGRTVASAPVGPSGPWTLPLHSMEYATHLEGGVLHLPITTSAGKPSVLVIDRESPDDPFRVRRVSLATGRVEAEHVFVAASLLGWVADATNDALIFAGHDDTIRSYDLEGPERARWSRRIPCRPAAVKVASPVLLVDSQCEYGSHEVYALRPEDGSVVWSELVPATQLKLFAEDGRLAWGRDETVSEVDLATGEELWTWSLAEAPEAVLRVADDEWVASTVSAGAELIRLDRTRKSALVHVSGRVHVRGFATNEGVSVSVDSRWSAVTDKDGAFTLDVPVRGTLNLWVAAPWDARAKALETEAQRHGAYSLAISPDTRRLDTEQDPTEGLDIVLSPSPVLAPD